MWYLFMLVLVALVVAGFVYVAFRAAEFPFVRRLAKGRKRVARLMCATALAALFAIIWLVCDVMNALVVLVHLALIWALCDLVAFLVGKVRQRRRNGVVAEAVAETAPAAEPAELAAKSPAAPSNDPSGAKTAITRRDFAGGAAVLLTAAYLGAGWEADHRMRVTRYAFETSKISGSVRIVQIADTHMGATFHAARFAQYMDDISALSPDMLVVTGDFVDDATSREDMLGGCAALGRVRATYGVFFVYGNHDRGYYSEERRGWTNAEMTAALAAAGVTVLEDAFAALPCGITVVGRQDHSVDSSPRPRMNAEALLADVDRSTYTLLLDHQPADFAGEAAAGADLVLCGHTHGGQMIPVRLLGTLAGINDAWYGHERRGGTDFIVSSGMSNWSLQFKTGCFSEYVVIDITGTR